MSVVPHGGRSSGHHRASRDAVSCGSVTNEHVQPVGADVAVRGTVMQHPLLRPDSSGPRSGRGAAAGHSMGHDRRGLVGVGSEISARRVRRVCRPPPRRREIATRQLGQPPNLLTASARGAL